MFGFLRAGRFHLALAPALVLPALFLPALALALVTGCGGSQEEAPYRIGVMESLTGPGESYGTVANQSKQMAAAEINAAGVGRRPQPKLPGHAAVPIHGGADEAHGGAALREVLAHE